MDTSIRIKKKKKPKKRGSSSFDVRYYQEVMDYAPFPVVVGRLSDNKILYTNEKASRFFNLSLDAHAKLFFGPNYLGPGEYTGLLNRLLSDGYVEDYTVTLRTDKKTSCCVLVTANLMHSEGGDLIFLSFNDISELQKTKENLRRETLSLEEARTALRVVLGQIEKSRTNLEDRLLHNVKELVMPYLNKLREQPLVNEQMRYLDIIETYLKDLVSPFMERIATAEMNLTLTEKKVARLIRDGMTVKEISSIMNVSESAINLHRQHIRNKMGLNGSKTSLRKYLLSLR